MKVFEMMPRSLESLTEEMTLEFRRLLPVPKFKKGLGTSVYIVKITSYQKITQPPEYLLKISKFTKFGLVLLHSNRPVSCQSSPKFHTNYSNSEIASPKSIQVSNFSYF